MGNDCPNAFWNGAHKFKPRYDKWIYEETDSKEKTYVHDICIRCGKIIKRTDNPIIEKPETK